MRVAIIGAGAAGLTTAWLLDPCHEVVLFEKSARLGGHVDTVQVERNGERLAVEAGVEFVGEAMSPTFSRLLGLLGVAIRHYPVTITIHHAARRRPSLLPPVRGCHGLSSLLRPSQLLELLRLRRFQGYAARVVDARDPSPTLEALLNGSALPPSFRDGLLYPLLLACWDVEMDELKQFSAYDVLKYLVLVGRVAPHWTEVEGGMGAYIDALTRALTRAEVRPGTGIDRITRRGDRYIVESADGQAREVDQVVVATNAAEASQLLARLEGAEERCRELREIEYFKTTIAVHGDRRWMPARDRDWSLVNIRYDGVHSANTVWKGGAPVFRSWITHETRPIEPLYAVRTYEHPKPTPRYFLAQRRLAARQGEHGLWLAGLYTHDIDCHESAILSAVTVVQRLDPGAPNLGRLMDSRRSHR
jgi:predicted NAD/FAD-binding protein